MAHYKKIEGANLYLSPMQMEDADWYACAFNDAYISDRLGIGPKMKNIQTVERWIEESIRNNDISFSIILKEDNRMIGSCCLMNVNSIMQTATLGIFIAEETYRSKGYGKEALNLLLGYGFKYLNLNNIMLEVFSFNNVAYQLYLKVGFKEIGRRRESYFCNNNRYDTIYMDFLKNDFVERIQ